MGSARISVKTGYCAAGIKSCAVRATENGTPLTVLCSRLFSHFSTPVPLPPSTTMPCTASDETLSYAECVDHFFQLESRSVRLRTGDQSDLTLEALRAIDEMLEELLNFGSIHLKDVLADRLLCIYEQSKTLHQSLRKRRSWIPFGQKTDPASDSKSVSGQNDIRKEMNDLLLNHFAHCTKRMNATMAEKSDFVSCVEAFISEIQQCWQ